MCLDGSRDEKYSMGDKGLTGILDGNISERHQHRISRPLLDRIDLYAEARQMQYEDLVRDEPEESTADIRQRVLKAHAVQTKRYQGSPFRFNADLSPAVLDIYCVMEQETKMQLRRIYEQKQLTARAYHRMIRVARTIADLENSEKIEMRHLNEAVLYRPADAWM